MVKHPSEADLALFSGGELGRWRRWRVERHAAECEECRRDISDFSALRMESAALASLPEVSWDQLAAEMKANIRLGLEAGECVDVHLAPRTVFSPRALAACLSLAALLVASVFLERPAPRVADLKPSEPVLETSVAGIQFREGNQSIMLLNRGARDINYMATGSAMRQSYVDAETGQVTVNNVYVQ
ncbi:MAG: zf-HC2 domain-containing protein [Acidobacteriia bacterium]|nr:zf-HC2 domain-containing protein [Terriglobia bacterium]